MSAAGGRARKYRALRELSCSRYRGAIREGKIFTKEAEPVSGLDSLLAPGCG